ncbi:MAG TPA: hypothetical protein VGG27_10990 [Magnetospirillaceae bacterium]|jgi:hypothetical protein
MLLVFRFRAWDESFGAWVVYPVKSTPERVAAMGGAIIPGTGEYVTADQLDELGQYHRPRLTGRESERLAPAELQNPRLPAHLTRRARLAMAETIAREPYIDRNIGFHGPRITPEAALA